MEDDEHTDLFVVADFWETRSGIILRRIIAFGLAIFHKTEKTGVAQKRSFSCTFLIKCPGQIEAMGHRIISCFFPKQGFDR